MPNGKTKKTAGASRGAWSRKFVFKKDTTPAWATKKSFQDSRLLQSYSFEKLCPECFVGGKFHDETWYDLAFPQHAGFYLDFNRPINLAMDYYSAGYLYPWTLLRFATMGSILVTRNNYANLSSLLSFTRDTLRVFVEDYSSMFENEIIERVKPMLDGASNDYPPSILALRTRLLAAADAGRRPPGGNSPLYQNWDEQVILSQCLNGVARDEWEMGLDREVRLASAALLRDDLMEDRKRKAEDELVKSAIADFADVPVEDMDEDL